MLDALSHEPEPEPPPFDEPEPEPESPIEEPPLEPEDEQCADEKTAVERQLAGRGHSLVEQANALQVVDAATYERAAELAKTFAGMIKDAEGHFDPDIAAAHALHASLCAKKNTFLAPLKAALEAMKTRASSWWRGEEQKREAERRRRDDEDRKRREEEKRSLAEQAKQAEARGDLESAVEIRQEAEAVDAAPPPPPPPSVAPKVSGFTPGRSNWTFEITNRKAFVAAVAGADRMVGEVERRLAASEVLEVQRALTPEELAVKTELLDLHQWITHVSATIPIDAVTTNDVYLRGRAKTDKNTLKWPGVRFYDKGSTSVRA